MHKNIIEKTRSRTSSKSNSGASRSPKVEASLLEQLELLWQVQTIDTEVTRSVRESHSRPANIERLKKELETLDLSLFSEGQLLESTESKINVLESELKTQQSNRTKLEKQKKRPGKAADLELLKLKIYDLEANLAGQTTRRLQIAEGISQLTEKQASLTTQLKSQEQLALEDANGLQEKLQQISSRRGQYLSRINGDLLSHYDRTRSTRSGIGIVRVRSKHCAGCNMALPPQAYVEVMRGNVLTVCPSCQRMLCRASDKEA